MIRVAVCDDDVGQLAETAALLEAFSASRRLGMSILRFESTDALLASPDLASLDVVFMDIEFHGKPQGIQAVQRINREIPGCQVVYLSNYLQYSVDVYRTDHVWFVLKSEFAQRLPEIFEKLARIAEAARCFILLPTRGQGIVRIPCQDIRFLERRMRITQVSTPACTYETAEKLDDIAAKLPATLFAHCHSSVVVNMSRIVALRNAELELDTGQCVPVSRRYARVFRERYFEWADRWSV